MTDSIDRDPSQRSRPQRRGTAPPPPRAKEKTQTYIPTDYLSDDPEVSLLFEGLLWFKYHGSEECQVGIHNSTKTSWPFAHQHELDVKVWEKNKDGSNCKVIAGPYHYADPKKEITGIQIDVNSPEKEGVYVFQKGDYFHRPDYEGKNNRDDWRWLIDFEYRPLYPEGITLDAEDINPGIWVNHGTFFTLVKTTYDFDLRSTFGGEVHHLGNVGLIAGGNIDLKPGGDVRLTIRRPYPHESVIVPPLKYDAQKRYQIDIRNDCMKNGVPCKPQDYGLGNDHNDFHLYNKTFKEPPGRRKYTLHRVQKHQSMDKIAFSGRADKYCFTKTDKEHIESNNEAPCGPVCAGGGGSGGT